MNWLKLVAPVLSKLARQAVDRALKHGWTTAQGTTTGVAVIGLLESFGCNMSLAHEAILGAVASAPGVLGTDPSKIAPTLLEAAKQAVVDAKARPTEGDEIHTRDGGTA